MMLLDKGYYDYDFEKTAKVVLWEDTVKSDEEVRDLLAGFGFRQFSDKKPETTEELQEYILKQMEEK